MIKIHLWCPSIRAEDGGVEAYSFALAKALRRICGEKGITVFVRNHGTKEVDAALGIGVRSVATGFLPRYLRSVGFGFSVILRAFLDRPDLIMTTHVNFSPFASIVRRWIKIPYWVSLHGYESWHIERASARKALATANRLLPVSGFTRDRVIQNYPIPANRIRVLHDTFEQERFSIGPKPDYLLRQHNLGPDDPIILTVGRLDAKERYKGHDRLLRALAFVQVEVPRVKYVIVGGGADKERLGRIAQEAKVSDAVVFAGRVPRKELPDYYRLCDLFAMPSTGEGFGIVFLEALATGKPVLAGNRDGAIDALRGGELGVLVDPDDERALAEAVTALLKGSHAHPLAARPKELRDQTVEAFGQEKFEQTVVELLAEMT